MDYFPAFLNLRGRACLLVGGGEIALRKARLLLAAGAEVTVVAPDLAGELAQLSAQGAIRHLARRFEPSDVEGRWLVVCATDDQDVQQFVSEVADAAGVFCNCVDNGSSSSYITPAIVDRGPVVVAISSGGKAPVLARRIRAQIESLLPASLARLATIAGEWRDAVQARITDMFRRRRFWETVLAGPVAAQLQSGPIDAAHATMSALLDAAAESDTPPGEAWLVGAGPGDPGLLTLQALQAMQAADVILHDRLVSEQVMSLARRDAERISVGKVPGCKANRQDDINALLVELVKAGKRVCRLKGGDPFVFGRGGEEVAALADAGLPYRVIPGVTAAAGCAASAGIPLTHRGLAQSVVLLTAHGEESRDTLDWPSLARDRQTLAFYMPVSRLEHVMNRLIEYGRRPDTPVAIVENGTTSAQRVIRGRLGQLVLLADAHRVEAPAMLIVGEVAGLRWNQSAVMPEPGPEDAAAARSAVH